MAQVQSTDLLLLNRGGTTFKGTALQLSDYIIEDIQDVNSDRKLFLGNLGDVNTGGIGINPNNAGHFLLADGTGEFSNVPFKASVDIIIGDYLINNDRLQK